VSYDYGEEMERRERLEQENQELRVRLAHAEKLLERVRVVEI